MGRLKRIGRERRAPTGTPAVNLVQEVASLRNRVQTLEAQLGAFEDHFYVPTAHVQSATLDEFMRYSTCSSTDFLHPRFGEICAMLQHPWDWHRKLWEWVFVVHHLQEAGVIRPGSKGLVFGVGTERLPALFASLGSTIVATDAPADVGESQGWAETGQHLAA